MMIGKEKVKTVVWVTLFAIAMGFLETAVVVYLRKIYYPDGFNFPLAQMDGDIVLVELLRELATVIMLLMIGYLAARSFTVRMAYFIYAFAIWDIFYYIFLKLILDWPESLMTWDILFLLPSTWTGPVLYPVIASLTMILLAFSIIYFEKSGKKIRFSTMEWFLLINGSIIMVIAFMWDYNAYLLKYYAFNEIFRNLYNPQLLKIASDYVPLYFNWWFWGIGEVIILIAIISFIIRNLRDNR
jgi:hypothetical protein